MQGVIKEASDTQTGEQGADAVWATTGPKDTNEPVKIFDMERELRTNLKDNPDAMKRGIDALRQRAQAFNGQQAETNAAGVNGVFKLLDGGTPMAAVMRSAEWLALPDLKKHEIRKTLQNEAHQAEQRAFTHEQRVFAGEQRAERSLLLNNGDAYLRYSDPDVLTKMTRPQVEATRTVFGFEGAQHLLQRFDSLTKAPEKIVEARMDKQDFDHVAEQMGLDPFNAKSPDKKAQLGELQFKVEQLINAAQVAKNLKKDPAQGLVAADLVTDQGKVGADRTLKLQAQAETAGLGVAAHSQQPRRCIGLLPEIGMRQVDLPLHRGEILIDRLARLDQQRPTTEMAQRTQPADRQLKRLMDV